MIPEVTQNNLYLLLPGKVMWMADMLMEDTSVSPIQALKQIYCSQTYKRLEKESTKDWHLGPVDLYNDFCMEHQPH